MLESALWGWNMDFWKRDTHIRIDTRECVLETEFGCPVGVRIRPESCNFKGALFRDRVIFNIQKISHKLLI